MLGIEQLFGGNPQQQGSLAAIAQILQASGPQRMPQSLYGILGGGLMAGQQAAQQAREQEAIGQLRAQQLEDGQLDLATKKRARDLQQQIDAAARGSVRTAGQQAAALPGGPTVGNAQRIGEFQDGFDKEGFIKQMMAIDPMQALKMAQQLQKAGPKFDAGITWVNGPDGKPMAVRTADDGSFKALDGLSPREKLEFRDAGNAVLGLDQYTGQALAKLGKGVSPDAALSAATQRRGQDMTDSRQRQMLEHQRQIGKAPTEFQGKSAAFGLRAGVADKTISSLTGSYSPSAINTKSNLEDWPLVGGMLGAATNKFALSDNDQRAEQAQRDFVNAVLRQESGAAIGADEFTNARRQYFPQPGDSEAVVQQKARNRQLAIQGLNSNAGRAAMTAPPPAGNGFTFLGFE